MSLWEQFLRWLAHRCETHDRYHWSVTAALEDALGLPHADEPRDMIEQFYDPDLTACSHPWCPHNRWAAAPCVSMHNAENERMMTVGDLRLRLAEESWDWMKTEHIR